jgi:hypothetical protein
MLGANPIALNLSEASHRIGNGSTGGLGAVHKRTGFGAVQHQLAGDQASSGVPLLIHVDPQVGKSRKYRFEKVCKGFPLQRVVKAGLWQVAPSAYRAIKASASCLFQASK